jgi:hypothetical protein
MALRPILASSQALVSTISRVLVDACEYYAPLTKGSMASYMIPRRVYAMVLCNCTLHTLCLAARYFLHSLAFEPGYFFAFTAFGTKDRFGFVFGPFATR